MKHPFAGWSGAAILVILASSPTTQTGARIDCVAGCGTNPLPGPAARVQLMEPFAVTFDRAGSWYIAEFKGHRVVRVDASGQAEIVAGTPVTELTLNQPHALAIASDQHLYVADTMNHRLVRLEPERKRALVVCGGEPGFAVDDGPADRALFNQLYDIAAHGDLLYIVDLQNRRIRALDVMTNVIHTVAGSGETGVPIDGARARFSPLVDPRAVAVDRDGRIYILERRGNALRVVERDGSIRTLVNPDAGLNGPKNLSADARGNVLIVDTENHVIRRYSPRDGRLTVIAGSGTRGSRLVGDDPLKTELNRPHGVYVHASGALYISDSENNRVLKLTESNGPAGER